MLNNKKRRQLRINGLRSLWGMGLLLYAGGVSADTLTYYPQWLIGGTASTCTFNYPTLQPLSQPRTLIVDNHLPNGSVLYSWDYASFAPNFSGGCTYGGAITSASGSEYFRIFFDGVYSTNGIFQTNNPGIGIKFYYTYHAKGSASQSSQTTTLLDGNVGTDTSSLGAEYSPTATYSYIGPIFRPISEKNAPYYKYYDWAANHFSMSLRGELIKTGNVSYTATPLTISTSNNLRLLPMITGMSYSSVSLKQPVLGGGGINIIAPSCRLTSPSDYEIDLGRWVHAGPGSHQPSIALPSYGSTKPINLKMECSGQLNNVQFSFQDTGASPLSNNNISVYDSIGGAKIDGLEIEMSYGGIPFKVNKLSDAATSFIKTNTGAQGAMKTNPSDLSFNSQATVQFSARPYGAWEAATPAR